MRRFVRIKAEVSLPLWKAYLNATFHCIAMDTAHKNVAHLQHT